MTLALELAGAYVGGLVSAVVLVLAAGRWYLRHRFGGMIDLLR